MKKIVISFALVVGALYANAQTVIEGTKLTDNWSIGVNAGATTPLTHSAFFKNARPAFGLEISKQLTPIFGLGIQGMGYVNTTSSKTAFDLSDVSLLGKFNLMNLFSAYSGTPRLFELEAVGGVGWMHYYQVGDGDSNSLSSRVGLNLNFNLGEAKAWTLALKPAIVYDLNGDFNRTKSHYNANNANFELTAGLTYHFRGSNGEHHLAAIRAYDQGEVDNLNNNINRLREELSNKDAQINHDLQTISSLKQQLDEANNRQPVVETVVETETMRIPEITVTFKQGRTAVDASQLPNVERVATYLNRHPQAIVQIRGYASPEGSITVNERIARERAEAVKSILVKKYRIDARRIAAEGQGVGNMFSEPDWNRVSICTITDKQSR
ncbi:MAG: OmpA family protein [Prevotellaceae bacterium]|jgi:outer membrane protein OmpA-like peptidoglycan-associated protein|nr:OmpA family protein [Prevotellaceae bacterium]